MPDDPSAVRIWQSKAMWGQFRLLLIVGIALTAFLAVVEDGYERWLSLGFIPLALGGLWWVQRQETRPGKPWLTLFPEGVLMTAPGMPDVAIPWTEVRDVRRQSHQARHRGLYRTVKVGFENVTALVVDRDFYERHIHVDSAWQRGPGWENVFVPDGERMLVLLHHEVAGVHPGEIHEAVRLRWSRYGRSPDAEPAHEIPLSSGGEQA